MPSLIIGLTGGIGSGKTTTSNYFASLGVDIIDADVIAHQLLEQDPSLLNTLIERFGVSFLHEKGGLDRAKLRDYVFKNPSAMTWLEGLMHPLILAQIKQQIEHTHSCYCIVSAALLLESKLTKAVHRVLVIDVPEDIQIKRTIERDAISSQTLTQVINLQLKRQLRLSKADDCIDNSLNKAHLKSQVHILHKKYMSMLAAYKQSNASKAI